MDPTLPVDVIVRRLTDYVLTRGTLGSLSAMRKAHTPVALGLVKDGFVIPHVFPQAGWQWKNWTDYLALCSVAGIEYWLQRMHNWREQGHFLLDLSMDKLAQLCGPGHLHHLLPLPQARPGEHGYTHVVHRQLTLWEFSNEVYLKPTGTDVLRGIVQLFLFGFPFTTPVIAALEMQTSLPSYVRSRLIHGELDKIAMGNLAQTQVSFFLAADNVPSSTDPTSVEYLINTIGSTADPHKVQSAYMQISSNLPHTQYLSSNSAFWQAMQDTRLLTGFPHSYQSYLVEPTHTPLKLGYHLWDRTLKQNESSPWMASKPRLDMSLHLPRTYQQLYKRETQARHLGKMLDVMNVLQSRFGALSFSKDVATRHQQLGHISKAAEHAENPEAGAADAQRRFSRSDPNQKQ